MDREGPALERMTRRIAETPQDFLEPPRIGSKGALQVAALVHDLLQMHGGAGPNFDPNRLAFDEAGRSAASITALLCWVLAEPELLDSRLATVKALQQQLEQLPQELAVYCTVRTLIDDGDRREELARLSLARLGLRPAGETLAQAQDRLSTISSVERSRVIAASRAAEQRAREVREALARKAAEESADKWGRE